MTKICRRIRRKVAWVMGWENVQDSMAYYLPGVCIQGKMRSATAGEVSVSPDGKIIAAGGIRVASARVPADKPCGLA